MINQQPILIAGPPRSGTTMLAGLLQLHGIWIGRARKTFFPTSNSDVAAENMDIKELMKEEAYRVNYVNWKTPLPNKIMYEDELKEIIETFVPQDTRWLVKTSWVLVFHRFWNTIYPNAKWIITKRSSADIFDSMNRHPRMVRRPNKAKIRFIKALQDRQEEVKKLAKNWVEIDVKKISMKDPEELRLLFSFLEMDLDQSIVETFIKPGKLK